MANFCFYFQTYKSAVITIPVKDPKGWLFFWKTKKIYAT